METLLVNIVLLFVPLSLFVGLAASAIGFAAGPLIGAILIASFDFDIYLAILLSLMVDLVNALVITVFAARRNLADYRLGSRLALLAAVCVVPGVYAGTLFIPANGELFRGSIGFVIGIVGIAFFVRGRRFAKGRVPAPAPAGHPTAPRRLGLLAGVAATGFLTGMVGVGGGANYSVLLILTYALRTRRAVGTAMLVTAATTIVALALISGLEGARIPISRPQVWLGAVIAATSAAGTFAGSRITYSLSERNVNYLVGTVVLIASVVVIVQRYVLGG